MAGIARLAGEICGRRPAVDVDASTGMISLTLRRASVHYGSGGRRSGTGAQPRVRPSAGWLAPRAAGTEPGPWPACCVASVPSTATSPAPVRCPADWSWGDPARCMLHRNMSLFLSTLHGAIGCSESTVLELSAQKLSYLWSYDIKAKGRLNHPLTGLSWRRLCSEKRTQITWLFIHPGSIGPGMG